MNIRFKYIHHLKFFFLKGYTRFRASVVNLKGILSIVIFLGKFSQGWFPIAFPWIHAPCIFDKDENWFANDGIRSRVRKLDPKSSTLATALPAPINLLIHQKCKVRTKSW